MIVYLFSVIFLLVLDFSYICHADSKRVDVFANSQRNLVFLSQKCINKVKIPAHPLFTVEEGRLLNSFETGAFISDKAQTQKIALQKSIVQKTARFAKDLAGAIKKQESEFTFEAEKYDSTMSRIKIIEDQLGQDCVSPNLSDSIDDSSASRFKGIAQTVNYRFDAETYFLNFKKWNENIESLRQRKVLIPGTCLSYGLKAKQRDAEYRATYSNNCKYLQGTVHRSGVKLNKSAADVEKLLQCPKNPQTQLDEALAEFEVLSMPIGLFQTELTPLYEIKLKYEASCAHYLKEYLSNVKVALDTQEKALTLMQTASGKTTEKNLIKKDDQPK